MEIKISCPDGGSWPWGLREEGGHCLTLSDATRRGVVHGLKVGDHCGVLEDCAGDEVGVGWDERVGGHAEAGAVFPGVNKDPGARLPVLPGAGDLVRRVELGSDPGSGVAGPGFVDDYEICSLGVGVFE